MSAWAKLGQRERERERERESVVVVVVVVVVVKEESEVIRDSCGKGGVERKTLNID